MAWKVPLFIQAEFSKTYPSFLTLKEGSTFLTKPLFPQGRENVAGSAIAPPEFWSASGACAHKGLAGSAYSIELRLLDATELRLLVGWRINLRIVCVKIMQEVWRCEGNNVFLHIQKDFKRLKGEDYGTDFSNGRFKPASAKHS